MDAKTLVGRVAGLYTLPEVYRQLTLMLEEGEGNECDLAELISYDPVLTARLFQLASELHADVRVASVSEALALLGGAGLQRRLDSTAAEAVFSKVPVDIVDMHDFWHHSVCCAMAAEALARRHDHLVPETMFLAGLVHDIGQLVIYQEEPEGAVRVLQSAGAQESHRYRMEQEILPWTHAEVGAELLDCWALPEMVCTAARYHHEPHLGGEFELQVSIVHIATAIANCIEPSWKAGEATRDALRQISPTAWRKTGFSDGVVDETVSEISIQSLEVLRVVDPDSTLIF